jgi:predicted nucleic acid-binding protein
MKLLLDTSILIDVLRRRNQRRELLANLVRAGHELSTTVLNVAELYSGMRPSEERETQAFLAALVLHTLDAKSAHLAGRLKSEWSRKGRTVSLPDAVIAALTLERGCTLMTDNRRDFPMAGLELFPIPPARN